MVSVDADFLEDVRVQLLEFIDRAAIEVPSTIAVDAKETSDLYFKLKTRLLSTKRRVALRSPTLLSRSLEPWQSAAVDEIARRAEAGEPLIPFLSRDVRERPETNDALLNEWGIYHFHLGATAPGPRWFVRRSGPLLFAFADRSNLYLIDVRNHHAFVDRELVEIIHRTWPQAIADQVAIGVSDSDAISNETRLAMRRSGLTVLTQTDDGTVYVPIGGGYTLSGFSMRAVMQSNRLLNAATAAERHCKERAEHLASIVEREKRMRLRELHLNLQLGTGELSVIETQSRVVFPVA